MATNQLSITAAHDKARIRLKGDMAVLFNTAVTSAFTVQLFTITSEIFSLHSDNFQFYDLSGNLTSSFNFGGKPNLFIEMMMDPTTNIWYIVATNSVSNSGSGGYSNGISELVFADSSVMTTTSLDATLGNTFTITLTANYVIPPITNPQPGQAYKFVFIQDKFGQHTLTFDKKYKFPNNIMPTPSVDSSTIDLCTMIYSSSGFYYCTYSNGYTITALARILSAPYETVASAVNNAADNDTIYITRSGQMAECVATIDTPGKHYTIASDPTLTVVPRLHVDTSVRLAGQKAIINVESGFVTVRDIRLDGAYSSDLSGAGVRGNPASDLIQLQRVTITGCNEGVLYGPPDVNHSYGMNTSNQWNITITDCTFDRNSTDPIGQAHNIYLNSRIHAYALRSRFTNALYGHDFKTRAFFVLLDRTFHEGATGGRELDVPNGGIIHAVNCYFIKDPSPNQGNLIGIGQEGIPPESPVPGQPGVARVEEYIFRNCAMVNNQGGNFGESFVEYKNGTQPLIFVDCVFKGSTRTIISCSTPFQLIYTGGPIGPEGWDQTDRGFIPKWGYYDGSAGNVLYADNLQPVPQTVSVDPTLTAFPPTGSTAVPSTRLDVADTIAPTVSLVSSDSTVTANKTITLSATAGDGVGVTKVEFYRNGTLIATDTATPYTTTVSLLYADNGTIPFTAKAYDAAGNIGTSTAISVVVNIPADVTPPVISVVSSDTTVTAAKSITLTAAATDNVGVVKVEFYRNGTLIATDTSAPFTATVALTHADNGTIPFTTKAYDLAGNVTTSSSINVTANIPFDSVAPVVSLATSDTLVSVAKSITLTATASDDVGVVKVEFYRNGTLVATDTTAPWTASVAFTVADNGTVPFTAKAYDLAGNSTMSTVVNVTVNVLPTSTVYPFSIDATTTSEYNAAIDAAATGSKRMAAANAIISAMTSSFKMNIYQESQLIIPMVFTGSMTATNDGTNVTLSVPAPDTSDPVVFADITAGTWHFELIGGTNFTRMIKGSVGATGSGKMVTLDANPTPGIGTNITLTLVVPRSIDGLT